MQHSPSSGSTRPTISIQQVEQILLGARHAGHDCDRLLQRAGIAPELMQAQLARVSQAQFAALVVQLRHVTRDELWGLCSRPLPLGSFEAACRLAVGCETLEQALRAGLRHYRLLLADFTPRLQVTDGVAQLSLLPRRPADGLLVYAQRAFAFLAYGLVCWLVARRLPLVAVDLPQSEAQRPGDAPVLFQAPLLHGVRTGWRFESRWLTLPVVQTAESLVPFLQQAPASLLLKYRDDSRLTERIRRILRRHLGGAVPSLEAVGELLAMTPQTLRRRLREEGRGFREIRDDLLRDAAIDYLTRPDLTLPEIASLLGFSEASTFHRAFKHWTGVAPGAYRQTRLG
ncbi:AraC family transcriptional regulator [Pseudorhodoferax sp. Leaf267]|uniref:AraC family transcriptional regulator n=1 Tax=Pseudorhodoferax sp. Leaf267 TaxID=1736316 RepID=UPI0006F29E54|nr:AraC family transcriptional regulator [Pseudorhodoferax sp. Leaf267]KQP13582.1 AraC family transcriptional regulator [Pseudorhodoferax sp. Leaf267]